MHTHNPPKDASELNVNWVGLFQNEKNKDRLSLKKQGRNEHWLTKPACRQAGSLEQLRENFKPWLEEVMHI
jgi:hypothetical protein